MLRTKLLVFFILAFTAAAWAQATFPAVHAIPQLIEPVSLKSDITHIKLVDYFKQPSLIDSITVSKGIKHLWNKKDNLVVITAQPELKPLAEMKLWSQGAAYCIVLKKDLKTDKPDPARPVINTSRLGRGSFTIAVNYSRSPFSIACYWQNFKLGKGYIKRANEEMMIIIPDEAQKMKRSWIRIYANDDVSRSNEILIPLEYGEVVNDPKQLGSYSDHIRDSLQWLTKVADDRDPGVAFALGKPLDSVAFILRKALAQYGDHNILSSVNERWTDKRINYKNTMLLAFIAAIPGVGIDSSYVDDFKDQNDKFIVSKLVDLHDSYLALSYGEADVAAKGDIMMLKRTYFSQTVLFVFNKSKDKQSIETGSDLSNYRSVFGHVTTGGKVELPPMSFEVLIK